MGCEREQASKQTKEPTSITDWRPCVTLCVCVAIVILLECIQSQLQWPMNPVVPSVMWGITAIGRLRTRARWAASKRRCCSRATESSSWYARHVGSAAMRIDAGVASSESLVDWSVDRWTTITIWHNVDRQGQLAPRTSLLYQLANLLRPCDLGCNARRIASLIHAHSLSPFAYTCTRM